MKREQCGRPIHLALNSSTYNAKLVARTLFKMAYPVSKLSRVPAETVNLYPHLEYEGL